MHTSSSDSRLPRDCEGEDEYYMEKMSEILDEPPNIGPPAHPGKMLDHVYIGNLDNAEDYDLLPALGITHVLNMAGTRNFDLTRSRYPEKLGITDFLMIPAEDYEEYDIAEHFHDAVSFLDRARASGGKAMVHCNLGVNRSGAVVAAYMMVHQRKPLLKVLSDLKSKRAVVLCNPGFRRQLLKYARCRGLLDPVEKTPPKGGINKSQSYQKINENEFSMERQNEQEPDENKESHFGLTNGHSTVSHLDDHKKYGSGTENGFGADTLRVPVTTRTPVRSSSGSYVPGLSSTYLVEDDGSSDDEETMRSIRLARASLTSSNYTPSPILSSHPSPLLSPYSSPLLSPQSLYPDYVPGSSGTSYVSPFPDRFTSSITAPQTYTATDVGHTLSSSRLSSTSSLSPSSTNVHPLLANSSNSFGVDNFQTTIKPRSYYHRKVLGRVPRFVDFEEESGDGMGLMFDGVGESIRQSVKSRQREADIGGPDFGGDLYSLTARGSSFPGRSVLDDFAYHPRQYVESRPTIPALNIKPRSASVTRSSELSNGSTSGLHKSYRPAYSARAGYVDDLDFDIEAYKSGMHSIIPRESTVRSIATRVTAPSYGVYPHSCRTISQRW